MYDVGEDWLLVRCTPQGEYFYGTLVQNAAAAQWQSMDGKQHRSVEAAQTVSMERRVPELDFVTECDNRVWGCNSRENVIYGCKLGDPTNWFSYRGIAADSYAVTVGSDGAFTGAASCMGYALFFKENTLHKLYGSKPSDFQLSSLRCRGVAKNAARSLCVLNETLYYLSPDGAVCPPRCPVRWTLQSFPTCKVLWVVRWMAGTTCTSPGRVHVCWSTIPRRGCGARRTSAPAI